MTTSIIATPPHGETTTDRSKPGSAPTSEVAAAEQRPRRVAKTAKKADTARKLAKTKRKPANGAKTVREGSKAGKILALLMQPQGSSLKELMKATGWQPHSIRGFLSGTIRKRMGLALKSGQNKQGERIYRIKP